MKIIKKIKIKNFRSFTWIKSEVVNLQDLNIFSWANDSWKSNIFRALNLFFNNEITHWNSFNIERDFSEQKKDWTHKVIQIRIDFELTTSGTKYLSKNFAIEKKYYRNNDYDYTFIYITKENNEIKISSNPELNKDVEWDEKQYRKQFNQFLGKVHFEYIPAIREIRYFSYLFWRVISKLREAEKDRISIVENFIKELENPDASIQKKQNLINSRNSKISWVKKKKWDEEYSDDYIKSLKREIDILETEIINLRKPWYISDKLIEQNKYRKKIAEFDSAIDNLSSKINTLSWDLFQNISFIENAEFTIADNLLDFFETFEIWTWDTKKISLKSRWDWMQSRFIPVILDFLSKVQKENEKWKFDWEYERNKYFIWWFEEPENSYEYSNSIRLSNNFVWLTNQLKDEYWDLIYNKEWKIEIENTNYSERKQIFITTHSEEFLRLFSEEQLNISISLYLIEKIKSNWGSWIKEITKNDLNKVHTNLWLQNIARSKLKFDISEKLNENTFLKIEIQKLMDEFTKIEKSKKNILFVEDEYINIYKIWFLKSKNINCNNENFLDKFNKNSSFDIFWNEGKSELRHKIDRSRLDEYNDKIIIWLFDFDSSYNEFNWLNWNRWNNIEGTDRDWLTRYRKDYSNIYSLLLPVPSSIEDQAGTRFKWNSILDIELYLFNVNL